MSTIVHEINQNDTARQLAYTLKLGSTVIDLTNASVTMSCNQAGTETIRYPTIDSPLSGSIFYNLIAEDTATAGIKEIEFEINFSDGTKLYVPTGDRIFFQIFGNV